MNLVIKHTIEKYNLLRQGDCIVVAVSGGADSMVLLDSLYKLKKIMKLSLVVAHVNHNKRQNSQFDEALVREVAKQYELPCEVYYLPKDELNLNFHAYARQARYDFFTEVAKKYHATKIATAHHQDDQLETFIHRMLYYSSLSSLVGIRPKTTFDNMTVIRPIFELKKEQVYEYCELFNVAYREDESNESDVYTRNRIRHHIVPALVKESQTVGQHVAQLSDQLEDDEQYFVNEVSKLKEMVTIKSNEFTFSRQWLLDLPISLSSRLIKDLLLKLTDTIVLRAHVLEVLKVCKQSKPNLNVSLPHGIHCIIEYDTVVLTKNRENMMQYEMPLTINDITLLPTGQILRTCVNKVDEKTEKSCINKVYLCYNEIEMPLKVRTRKPGDKIKLMHNIGHKKVKEIMIEAKVPKRQREHWPIIVDNRDEIIWIPLLKKSSYCQDVLNNYDVTIEIYNSEG